MDTVILKQFRWRAEIQSQFLMVIQLFYDPVSTAEDVQRQITGHTEAAYDCRKNDESVVVLI
jgi:hypothetical protein